MGSSALVVLSVPFSYSIPTRLKYQTFGVHKPNSSLILSRITTPSYRTKFTEPKTSPFHPISPLRLQRFQARSYISDSEEPSPPLVGEDSASFNLADQNISSWLYFTVILGVVLFALDVLWIDNSTGFGKSFIEFVSTFSDSHEVSFI